MFETVGYNVLQGICDHYYNTPIYKNDIFKTFGFSDQNMRVYLFGILYNYLQ